MKIKSGFILRNVGGEDIVVPVGERSKEFHCMINLNETGAFLWKFFTAEHTIDEAVEALCQEYDVSAEIARKDVERLAQVLLDNKLAE